MNSFTSISDTAASWRYTRNFLLLWLALLVCPAIFIAVVDPYQVLHKSFFAEPFFYKDNERYQVAGLLRNYLTADSAYDSVIVGSSLSGNFDGHVVKDRLGWTALNLSVRASSLAERSFVLEKAIATGKVKHVLLEINPVDIMEDDLPPANDPRFPFYLYQDSLISKWRYIFNESSLLHACALVFKDTFIAEWYREYTGIPLFEPDAWGGPDISHWSSWIDSAERANAFVGYNNPVNLLNIKKEFYETKKHQLRDTWEWNDHYPFVGANQYIVKVVREHPEIEFRIWFGTVSLLRYAGDINMDAINRHVELRRFLAKELSGLPNVKIYSLDNDLNIVGDLGNYMDVSHTSRAIQQYTLDEISKDTHRLTKENVDAFADLFYRNIMNFDIKIPGE